MIESHLFAGYLVLLRDVFQTPTVLSTKGAEVLAERTASPV